MGPEGLILTFLPADKERDCGSCDTEEKQRLLLLTSSESKWNKVQDGAVCYMAVGQIMRQKITIMAGILLLILQYRCRWAENMLHDSVLKEIRAAKQKQEE